MRILLVEDDTVLGEGLRDGLGLDGHRVDWLTDGELAMHALDADRFDAALLDLMLPGRSGAQVLAHWRAAGHDMPVLVLTARDKDDDCIDLLDAGADDYVTKPAALGEIQARLRALTRRAHGQADNRLACGDLVIDSAAHGVWLAEQPIACSSYEFAVLQALFERAGTPVSREHLETTLYGWTDGPESNSLEVLMHKLRAKIGAARIETVRGLGYRLVP